MKNIFFQTLLIFFLIFFSNVKSKEIKVSKINLLDNIEKHILLKEVNNYLFESKYSGKNKKYSTFNIRNSTFNIQNSTNFFKDKFFKDKESDIVQIIIDNKDYKIHSIGEIGAVNSTHNNCSKLIDDIIDEFKFTYKINLNDKSIVTSDIKKEIFEELTFEYYSYYPKKNNYLFYFQCTYLTSKKDSSNNNYILGLTRVTKEYNDWLVNAKK